MTHLDYVGAELEIFAKASNWKRYFRSIISSSLRSSVLEVGAGLGATTAILCDGSQTDWLCLEPDPVLLAETERKIHAGELPACCRAQLGLIANLADDLMFDSIIYIDVLEHIENDRGELEMASRHLACGGQLIVLSPAYSFLYSPFDKAIGHYRRYNRAALTAITPKNSVVERLMFMDSVGLLTSLANRFLLRQSTPTESQILFWDQKLIPISKFLDRLLGYRFGRSILAIWRRS